MTEAPLWTLAPFLGLVFLASLTGAVFRPGAWYKSLRKPSWTPPDFVFPLVWGLLYAAMAYAAWRVWATAELHPALAVWGVQLALNALWSAVFFGLRRPGWALAEVALLWLAVAANIYAFTQVDALAAWLLAPYLAWVSLAAFLNLEIVRLRKAAA
ncbi:tryptophan-rich sensory protein [Alkalicaulis satelles]|uniref:Tryptophan-rich sensory protein n=1 Tax=Alkalicaulis satelles TaxID=2609175 RepID=A0A5M6ZJ60_9PROT|nr:TspO/MBR family protein [Alkalicaulis satelles]KAA5804045.1 tryptophan-rich sensory protein [Alkalicaulis satelles]